MCDACAKLIGCFNVQSGYLGCRQWLLEVYSSWAYRVRQPAKATDPDPLTDNLGNIYKGLQLVVMEIFMPLMVAEMFS